MPHLGPALARTPVNAYEFESIIAETRPELFLDFERSDTARIVSRVDGDSNSIVSRTFSARVWAGVWAARYAEMDRAIPAAKDTWERNPEALARLDKGLSKLYADHFELYAVEEYKPFIAGSGYSLVTEMQAVIRCALFRPSIETLADFDSPKACVRVLREMTDTLPLRVVIAILPTVAKVSNKGTGVWRETVFRNARILETHGVPLEESARLLARYPHDKVHELFAKVGIPFEYLEALDG